MSIHGRKFCVVAVATLVACSATPTRTRARDCVDPRTYGAIVNDGRDDRAAVQMAIDDAVIEHKDVCLPAGDLHIARRPGVGISSIPSLIVAGDGVGIFGVGAGSRLVMLDAITKGNDWWVIQVSGSHHVLRDFAMDGAKRGVTDQQTHLIQVLGPASNIKLDNLRLSIPVISEGPGGDCIRMLGEADATVHNVTITRVKGEACARSFIAFQRFVSDVVVDHVQSVAIGGSAIDMEPTGDGVIHDVTIRNSEFRRGTATRGGAAVQLSGTRAMTSYNIVVEDNMIESGIWVYQVQHLALRRNKIEGDHSGRPMVQLVKNSSDVDIVNNELDGFGGDGISLSLRENEWPSDVRIHENHIRLSAAGFAIHAEPAVKVDITGNTLLCSKLETNAAVFLRGVAIGIASVTVRKNMIDGCSEAVRVAQHGELKTGSVVVEDNTVLGAIVGVKFENGIPSVLPVIDRNVFKNVPSASQATGLDARGFQGSNSDR